MTHTRKLRRGFPTNTTEQLFEYLDRVEARLDRIESKIDGSRRFAQSVASTEIGLGIMNTERLQRMLTDVAANTDAVAANTKAWTEAFAALRAAQGSDELPPEFEAALSQLEANTAALAAAPIAGTAADPGTTGGEAIVVPPVEQPVG